MTTKHKYWVTFRFFLANRMVEGDLVAETEKLDENFFRGVKDQVTAGMIQQNGGVLVREMSEPTIQVCILLDD
jgi:hypothetical protein